MPPKKKARQSSRAASGSAGSVLEETSANKRTNTTANDKSPALQGDDWTDEQEAALFKGMHKHFRMIALSQHLHSHGYDPSKNEHLRIPGIWKKLDSLYHLEALDERENAFSDANSPESDRNDETYYHFSLPREEYGEMVFEKRLAPDGSPSPADTVCPSSVTSTSAAATRRGSTAKDMEGLLDVGNKQKLDAN
ncbi:MAG: hypothetical protein Q9170_003292 [Blastenia crenularia]